MLEIVKIDEKYNVLETSTNKYVLNKNYDDILLEGNGILAIDYSYKNKDKTDTYIFNQNGKLLCEFKNMNCMNKFYFYKNFIEIKRGEPSLSIEKDDFYYIDYNGEELPDILRYFKYFEGESKNNIVFYGCPFFYDTKKDFYISYKINTKQIVVDENNFRGKIEKLAETCCEIASQRVAKIYCKTVKESFLQMIEDRNFDDKNKLVAQNAIIKAMDNFEKHYNTNTFEDYIKKEREKIISNKGFQTTSIFLGDIDFYYMFTSHNFNTIISSLYDYDFYGNSQVVYDKENNKLVFKVKYLKDSIDECVEYLAKKEYIYPEDINDSKLDKKIGITKVFSVDCETGKVEYHIANIEKLNSALFGKEKNEELNKIITQNEVKQL